LLLVIQNICNYWYLFVIDGGNRPIVALGFGAGGVPFLVELVEAWVVIRNPFLGGLPGGARRTHSMSLGK